MKNEKVKSKNDREQFKQEFGNRIYQFVLDLLKFLDGIKDGPTVRVIRNQLLRSGTSVLANYVEASGASSRRDFTNFFHHALKSGNESLVWLKLLRDGGYADTVEAERLIQECTAIVKIITKSIITLKKDAS